MNRFSLFHIAILMIVASSFTACQTSNEPADMLQGKNIISNSGFEEGTDQPSNWEHVSVRTGSQPEFKWEMIPETRSHNAGIECSEPGLGGLKQTIDLEPDSLYRLKARIKTVDVSGRGLGATVFFPKFRWVKPFTVKGSQDWQTVEKDYINAGFTSLDLVCAFGVNGYNSGTAYFDDIEVFQIPDPINNPKTTEGFALDTFDLRYNKQRGYLTSLKPTNYTDAPDFLASYTSLPFLDTDQDHFLGDLSIDIQNDNSWIHLTTADEEGIHTVEARQQSLVIDHRWETDFNSPVIHSEMRTTQDSNSFIWRITLKNPDSQSMEIGSVEFPIPWNNNYCLFDPHDKASQKLLYTRRVAEHKHIGGVSSYVLACPLDGTQPILLIHPDNPETQFEFAYHDISSIRNQKRDKDRWIHGAWPGLTRICLVSNGTIERNNWANWLNPHTSIILGPGEEKTYQLRFHWLLHRNEVATVISKHGLLGLRVIPGLAIPNTTSATILIYGAKSPVTVEGCTDWEELSTPSDFDGAAVKIQFSGEGPRTVVIHDSLGKNGKAFMYSLPSVSELMNRRAQFIIEKQVYHSPGDPLDGAILCYNNRAESVLATTTDMWGSGGYEGGITDAMFLALKNTTQPVKTQIGFLESYIDNWLLGSIQNPSDFGVCWMVARKNRTERGYNYIHVLNLYDAMARGSAVWPDLFTKTPEDYLSMWEKTFTAFRRNTVKYQDLGLMGRGNIAFMPELFRRFNMDDVASSIEEEIATWSNYWSQEPPYPYGSELFFDNTGYESVFFYRDYIGKTKLAQQMIDVTKAGRGRAPCWFWNDSDQRWWDAVRTSPAYDSFTDFGENCHHYMTGLNGYMLLEAFDRGYGRGEPGPIGYSGILNSWARVQSDGFAGMCYCPDPASDNLGLNQFTGDVGLGLWGNLKAARCYLIDDEVLGVVAYGGKLIQKTGSDNNQSIQMYPEPGLNHRVRLIEYNLFLDSEGPAISKIIFDPDENRIELTLNNLADYLCNGYISIHGLQPGTYKHSIQSTKTQKPTNAFQATISEGKPFIIQHKFDPNSEKILVIAQVAS